MSELQWEMTFNAMTDPIMILDRNYTILRANVAQVKVLGLQPEEILGKTCFTLMHSSDRPIDSCPHHLAMGDCQEHLTEVYDERLGGHFLVKVTPILDERGEFIGSVHVAQNVSEIKKTAEELKRLSDEYERVFHGSQDAMFLVEVLEDRGFRYMRNNKTHQTVTGLALEDIRGKTPHEVLGEELGSFVVNNYTRCVSAGVPIIYEEKLSLFGGEKMWRTTLTPVSEDGRISYIVGSALDITQLKLAEKQLLIMATMDELTGLWNRRYFLQSLEKEMERAQRFGQVFSLLMFDIDHFKSINDLHGHAGGDEVLRHCAGLMREKFRQVDVLGRLGGEEFGVILPQTGRLDASFVAEGFRSSIENSTVRIDKTNIAYTVSGGVASYQPPIASSEELLKVADNALYEAKRSGRNRTVKMTP